MPNITSAIAASSLLVFQSAASAECTLTVEPTALSDKYVYVDQPEFYQVRPRHHKSQNKFDYESALFVKPVPGQDLASAVLKREDVVGAKLSDLSPDTASKLWGPSKPLGSARLYQVTARNMHREFDFEILAEFEEGKLTKMLLRGRQFPEKNSLEKLYFPIYSTRIDAKYAEPTFRWGNPFCLPAQCTLKRIYSDERQPLSYVSITGSGRAFVSHVGEERLLLRNLTPERADNIFGPAQVNGNNRRYFLRRGDKDYREVVFLDLHFKNNRCDEYRCAMPFLSDNKWYKSSDSDYETFQKKLIEESKGAPQGLNASKTFRKVFPLKTVDSFFEESDDRFAATKTLLYSVSLFPPMSDPEDAETREAAFLSVSRAGRPVIVSGSLHQVFEFIPTGRLQRDWGKYRKHAQFVRFTMKAVGADQPQRRVYFDIRTDLPVAGVCRISGLPGVQPHWQWVECQRDMWAP